MIKVFSLIGSGAGERSRTAKLSDVLAEAFRKRAAEDGEEVIYERLTAADVRLDFCRGCESCFRNGFCPMDSEDDMGMLRQKILECDVLFIGSPVYMGRMSGFTKCVIDRIASMAHCFQLLGKPMLQFVTTSSNHGQAASKDLEYLLRFFYGALINAGAFYEIGHPNLNYESDMQPILSETAERLMQAYRDPRTAVTDFQQQTFFSHVLYIRRAIRLGAGDVGEVKAAHDAGYDRYVLLTEAIENLCMREKENI